MSKLTHSELVDLITNILYGASFHKEELEKVGFVQANVDELENLKKELETLNSEKNRLKALSKTKTEEYDEKRVVSEEKVVDAKTLIKLVIPQSLWKEFGVDDKK